MARSIRKLSPKKANRRAQAPREARSRRHTLNVGIGLHILRYVSTRTPDCPPVVHLKIPSGNGRNVILMRDADPRPKSLSSPGDFVFINARRPSAIVLTVKPLRRGGSLDAEVRLDRVTSTMAGMVASSLLPSATPSAPQALGQTNEGITVLAHVSHRGDVFAKSDEWICGPELPIAIEGLEISWAGQPAGVELSYLVQSGGRVQRQAEGRASEFVGTRGCASPIVKFAIGLSGPNAQDYELSCDALFLGAPVMTRRGHSVSASGPSGREPLVGLRISIDRRRDRAAFDMSRGHVPRGPLQIYRPKPLLLDRVAQGSA